MKISHPSSDLKKADRGAQRFLCLNRCRTQAGCVLSSLFTSDVVSMRRNTMTNSKGSMESFSCLTFHLMEPESMKNNKSKINVNISIKRSIGMHNNHSYFVCFTMLFMYK